MIVTETDQSRSDFYHLVVSALAHLERVLELPGNPRWEVDCLDAHRVLPFSNLRSELDGIPGIGPRRRRALLTKFGSLAGVRRATREELEQVVGANAARAVIDYFAQTSR